MKQRFKQFKQPMRVDLTNVNNEDLFTELMNRIIRRTTNSVYFIDQTTGGYDVDNPKWKIHTADDNILIEEN
jgi:hypothetical protein